MKNLNLRMGFYSLNSRLSFFVGIILLSIFTIIFVLGQYFFSQLVQMQFENRAKLLAENLAALSYQPLLNNDQIFLDQTLAMLSNQTDVLSVAICNSDGEMIARRYKAGAERFPVSCQEYIQIARTTPEEIYFAYQGNKKLLQVFKPIKTREHVWGGVMLALSTFPYQIIKARVRWISVAMGLGFVLLGLLSTLRISRRVTAPIQELIRGTEEVSSGNFNFQLSIEDEGELGQLTRKFNEMTLQLNYYYKQKELLNKKLHEYSDVLEERIKERTKQIRKIKEEVVQILQQIPVGILVLNCDQQIRWYNDEILKILDIRHRKHLTGKNIAQANVIKNSKLVQTIRNALKEGDRKLFQFFYETPEGDKRVLEIHTQPLRLEQENKPGMIFTVMDITEEMELEKRVNRMQRLESMGVLAGGIAHDFNNILTIILPNAQMLKMKLNENRDLLKYVETIEKAIDRAAQLTSQILSFARGSRAGELTVVDLNSVLSDFVSMFRRVTDRKIEIKTELDPNLWKIEVDRGQIDQVLMNLSVNARDAMPAGGVITYRTNNFEALDSGSDFYPVLKEGQYVLLEICDSGVGIPPEKIDRIFDPFFTDKREGKGTGLGLSLVYGIIKNYDGLIDVASEQGKGTKFTIYLPATDKELENEIHEEVNVQMGKGGILLVDDEELLQETVSKLLESLNYQVMIAQNGKDAIEKFSRYHDQIDLVLMDLQMPEMDGFEAADKIWAQHPQAKIVFSSGYADPMKIQELKRRGVKYFLKKPYKLKELTDIITSALNNSH